MDYISLFLLYFVVCIGIGLCLEYLRRRADGWLVRVLLLTVLVLFTGFVLIVVLFQTCFVAAYLFGEIYWLPCGVARE